MVVLTLVLTSCEKIREDLIPPVIVLDGRNPDTMLLGCVYSNPGAIVKDDKPNVTYTVTGSIPTDSTGVFFLDYTAIDSDKNKASVKRKVVVTNYSADFYNGTFSVTDSLGIPFPSENYYETNITRLNENQNIFKIQNFNNFGATFEVLIEPDSTGAFALHYEASDTLIQGGGYVNCDYKSFLVAYQSTTPEFYKHHRATYER